MKLEQRQSRDQIPNFIVTRSLGILGVPGHGIKFVVAHHGQC
jgi:hypothetical protein